MTQSNSVSTNNDDQRNKNAFRISVVVLVASIIGTLPLIYLAGQWHIWRIYTLLALVTVIAVVAFVGMRLIRNGRTRSGMLAIIISTIAILPFSTLLVSDLGIIMGFVIAVISYVYASQTMQSKDVKRIVTVGIVVGILVAATDFLPLQGRLRAPLLETLAPINVTLSLLAIGYFVVQRAWRGSIRAKLLTSLITLSVVAVAVVATVVTVTVRSSVQEQTEASFQDLSQEQILAIENFFIEKVSTLNSFALSDVIRDQIVIRNESYQGSEKQILAGIEALDVKWRGALDTDPLILNTTSSDEDVNQLAAQLHEFSERFEDHVEVFVTDRYGANIAATNRLSDYYQADEEWWQAAWNNGEGALYISDPEFDESAGVTALLIALPILDEDTREPVGILRSTVIIDSLYNVLDQIRPGETGYTMLFDREGNVLMNPFAEQPGTSDFTHVTINHMITESTKDIETSLSDVEIVGQNTDIVVNRYGNQVFVSYNSLRTLENSGREFLSDQALATLDTVKRLGWTVVVRQDADEALSAVTAVTRNSILVSLLVVLAAAIVALVLAQSFVRPIGQLTNDALQLAEGNLSVRSQIKTNDEIGILASTFNNMSSQLQEILQGLEERVAARTRNLELAAQVGRAVSQVRSLDVMLKDACELILKEFNLYYVQVYLTDPNQTKLVLEAGTGEVGAQLLGRGHNLPLDSGSINGRAAVDKHSVVISDTSMSTIFRKNPLLPETRGEMAVPLIVADKVVGVLDMQSSDPDVLSEEVLPAFEALAGQLAVAVQNANLLTETELARAQVESQARRLVREGWSEHLDAIHKPEQLGYVFDSHNVIPLAETDPTEPEIDKAISAPIALTGEELGSLVVELDDGAQTEQTTELVNVVARQVAQQIENLRLLESAERYRAESERTARLQTLEGWQKYVGSRNTEKLGFLYNSNEVLPHSNGTGEDTSMFALPLKARDEMIGKLSVQGLMQEDQESIDLVNAVAERLSAHIENLRLFEETRHGQLELDKRAKQLASVAEISTASSQELDVDKLLKTVVHLTQRQFDLYHAHVFVFNEMTRELEVTACGWEEGNENEGTHEKISIPLEKEQSLVARAARTGRAVIVNDVKSEPGWLPNPLLPKTASEMAVPLVVGDKVVGVVDVQSDRLNAFTEEDANIQTTLASQVATALQNARSFTQAQKQAEREAMLNVINQKIQSATSVEAVLQIAARELGTALGAPMTVAQLSMKDRSS